MGGSRNDSRGVSRSEILFRLETERNRIGREVIELRIRRMFSVAAGIPLNDTPLGALLDKLADAEANIELLKRPELEPFTVLRAEAHNGAVKVFIEGIELLKRRD